MLLDSKLGLESALQRIQAKRGICQAQVSHSSANKWFHTITCHDQMALSIEINMYQK